jgi:hypothetical protein
MIMAAMPASAPMIAQYTTRMASHRGSRLVPIGTTRWFSIAATTGPKPMATRPAT